jgi:hypothetical protein
MTTESNLGREWQVAFESANIKDAYELLSKSTLDMLERYCLEDIVDARSLKDLYNMFLVPPSDQEALNCIRHHVLRERYATLSTITSTSYCSNVPNDIRCMHEHGRAEWCVRPRDRTELCMYHHLVKYEPNSVFGSPKYEM